ncbi:Phenol hydroxylase P2 protein [Georgfuchsia toluolica]|uniref:Phenol hydroxylase P2 protein n=1 Tax=Georgfuchsia toluolica TaxID=424218 RepID=A0A916J7L2_9PROT|nr:MmoB/DmpM family protein [Georgfuchsia toluolica]CAG4885417.1 Phenol hydroxylase P2 protein [Georgfuchsia toluolica]CAG4885439.1 Phenol hydroxylase P2 protein [Georgfuchsia toluolica]
MSNVFIAFQRNEETRGIIEAILEDNPTAIVNEQPAMVKIDVPGSMTIKRTTIEEKMGRSFELQEMQANLITLSGYVDETDDEFNLSWKN